MQSSTIGAVHGLRAVALVVVVASSAGFSFATTNAFALDIILILSGFLVAASLRREYAANGTVDVRAAIGRRIVRIVPAVTIVSLVGIALDKLNVIDGLVTFRGSAAHLATISNLAGRANPDTIGGGTELLWPVFVVLHAGVALVLFAALALHMSADRGRFAAEHRALLIAGSVVAVLFWRIAVVLVLGTDHPRIGIASDLHVDAILAGALLGLSVDPRDPALRQISSQTRALIFGLSAVTFVWLTIAAAPAFETTIEPSLHLVVALPVVFFALHPASPGRRVLEHPAAQSISRLSFALFLTHLIGIRIAQETLGGAPRLIVGFVGLVLAFGAAEVLHQCVIEPCQRLADRIRPGLAAYEPRTSTASANTGILRPSPPR